MRPRRTNNGAETCAPRLDTRIYFQWNVVDEASFTVDFGAQQTNGNGNALIVLLHVH